MFFQNRQCDVLSLLIFEKKLTQNIFIQFQGVIRQFNEEILKEESERGCETPRLLPGTQLFARAYLYLVVFYGMSAVGIDVGALYSKVAILRGDTDPATQLFVEIVPNDLSKFKTATRVGFRNSRRIPAEHCEAQQQRYVKSSCRALKQLLGKTIEDLTEKDKLNFLFPLSYHPDERNEISVSLDNQQSISMRHLVGMFFTRIYQLLPHKDVKAVVVSVPPYYSNRQRCSLQDALMIAGMKCTRLVEDHIATAFLYTLQNRKNLPNPKVMAFCNASESYFSCAIVVLDSERLAVLSERHSQEVSGRNMIQLLMKHFASQWEQGDCQKDAKARLKLELACRKCMETLTANKEAALSVDAFMNGDDFESEISRKEFEEMCSEMKQNIIEACRDALKQAKVVSEDLPVELVGGCSRIPFVQDAIKEAFSVEELLRSLNADESVARGCTLIAGDLSGHFRVPLLTFEQVYAFGVELCVGEGGRWKKIFPAGTKLNSQVTLERNWKLPVELSARKVGSEEKLGHFWLDEQCLEKWGLREWTLVAEISLDAIFSISAVSDGKRFQLKSDIYLDEEEVEKLIEKEENA